MLSYRVRRNCETFKSNGGFNNMIYVKLVRDKHLQKIILKNPEFYMTFSYVWMKFSAKTKKKTELTSYLLLKTDQTHPVC